MKLIHKATKYLNEFFPLIISSSQLKLYINTIPKIITIFGKIVINLMNKTHIVQLSDI